MFSSFFKSTSGTGSGTSGSTSFETGAEVRLQNADKHLFKLYEGSLKSGSSNPALAHISSNELSVFVCDNPSYLSPFSTSVKRLKTLRHPSIVTFIDAIETDTKITLVTERVVPLSVHLSELDEKGIRGAPRDHYIAWGIFQVMRGLAFLNIDAKLRHNCIHGDAIFVTKSGDWKLFALDRVSQIQSDASDIPGTSPMPALQKYDPPELNDPAKRRQSTQWSRDMWGLGCVIWEVFNGPLPAAKNLGQIGNIPKKLGPLYMELVAANPAKRPNPKEKIELLRRGTGYFKNELIDVLLFLEELHLKDDTAKSKFYSSLGPILDNFPTHVGSYKILPELIKAFEFGNAGAAILNPVFKLGTNLESDEYVKVIVPCLVKLFASNDRNARFKLLNQVEHFVKHLSDKLVNDEVFPHIQNGFLDQEPMIREKTVISMIYLAPKLTYSNLDETVVLKHFARLLRDEQAGIRTNTTVCLGKIAQYLHYQTRQKVLISAFAGKLRDPFPPARIAAINAFAATQQFYTIQETSSKILPALCHTLTDPEEPVRAQGFKVTQGFIAKLEQVSKKPELKEEMEAEVLSTSSKQSSSRVAGWANWAVGAIGAKFYKSNVSNNKAPTAKSDEKEDNNSSKVQSSTVSVASSEKAEREERMRVEVEDLMLDDGGSSAFEDGANDGWDDADADWGSLEESSSKAPPAQDELFQDFGVATARKTTTSTAKKTQDSWDSWGDPVPISQGNDDEKALREEKRAQRKAEMEAKRQARKAGGGGPMKLGAKKC